MGGEVASGGQDRQLLPDTDLAIIGFMNLLPETPPPNCPPDSPALHLAPSTTTWPILLFVNPWFIRDKD